VSELVGSSKTMTLASMIRARAISTCCRAAIERCLMTASARRSDRRSAPALVWRWRYRSSRSPNRPRRPSPPRSSGPPWNRPWTPGQAEAPASRGSAAMRPGSHPPPPVLGMALPWACSAAQNVRPPVSLEAANLRTASRNTSPRCSKSRNISKLAHDGDNRTVSPGAAISAPRCTAASSVETSSRGQAPTSWARITSHAWPSNSSVFTRVATRGRSGAKSPPLSFPPAIRMTPPV